MARQLLALSLYVGLGSLFAVNAIALLSGVSMTTAVMRGLAALALFAVLGVVASLASRVRADSSQE